MTYVRGNLYVRKSELRNEFCVFIVGEDIPIQTGMTHAEAVEYVDREFR